MDALAHGPNALDHVIETYLIEAGHYACSAFFLISRLRRIGTIARFYGSDRDRPHKQRPMVNEFIPYRFKTVRVIRPDGSSSVVSRDEALREAEALQLDLYCISPNSNPPVCKILNFGKYQFDQKKKEKEISKNRKDTELKEIRFTPQTDTHDLETKANQAIKFLEKGNKLKVSLFVRGRMVTKMDLAEKTLKEFIGMIGDNGVVEKQPTLEGKYYFCYISPKAKK